MSAVNRRQFVSGIAACACATCPVFQALAAPPKELARPVDVGGVSEFRRNGIYDPVGAGRKFFLISRGGRLYAVSSTCTHKKVGLVIAGDKLKCPRHGSGFTTEGRVTKSPARKSLPRYAIRLNNESRVIVDVKITFPEGAWDDPASFVNLDDAAR